MSLHCENVVKTYGGKDVLHDVTLDLKPGKIYGLIGRNGAGKTTLIKMLTTLLFPTSGQILWNGEDIHALDEAYRGLLGYLPQEFGYYPHYSPRQFLRYAAALQCVLLALCPEVERDHHGVDGHEVPRNRLRHRHISKHGGKRQRHQGFHAEKIPQPLDKGLIHAVSLLFI